MKNKPWFDEYLRHDAGRDIVVRINKNNKVLVDCLAQACSYYGPGVRDQLDINFTNSYPSINMLFALLGHLNHKVSINDVIPFIYK